MTRALVWKELREQWAVWLVLALAAAGGAAGLVVLKSPGQEREELLVGLMWCCAWGYGLVCGSLLLARENEEGTQAFLDGLPATRRWLWSAKAGTGLALLAGQFAVLTVIGFLMGTSGLPVQIVSIEGMLFCGVVGYAWGLFCGSFAPSVLGAIARAVLWQVASIVVLAVIVGGAVVAAHLDRPEYGPVFPWAMLISATVASAASAARSWQVYGRDDSLRAPIRSPLGKVQSYRTLIWLAWRQARWFAAGLGLFGLAAGPVVGFLGVLAWPVVALLIGVLCGVTTFADEQRSGAAGAWSDQRWPHRRIWIVKVGCRIAIGSGALALAALGATVVLGARLMLGGRQVELGIEDELIQGVVSGIARQLTAFLTLWPVYGYTVGLLCGYFFRRMVVAFPVAMAASGLLAGAWLPSVVIGGRLDAWQLWTPPAILLLASLVLLRAWIAGQLRSAKCVTVGVGAMVGAPAAVLVGLYYRAIEIPPAPDPVDLKSFVAGLPRPEENEGGRLAAGALRRYGKLRDDFTPDDDVNLESVPSNRLFAYYEGRANEVAQKGWSNRGSERLGRWMDRVFAVDWDRDLARAAELPPGPLVDGRELTVASEVGEISTAFTAGTLLVARGMRRQARGEPEAFVEDLRISLWLDRCLERTWAVSGRPAPLIEWPAMRALDSWLERLQGRPDLLRRVSKLLLDRQSDPPPDMAALRAAEYSVRFNTLVDPRRFPIGPPTGLFFPSTRVGDNIYRLALLAPWETVRFRRELDVLVSLDLNTQRALGDTPLHGVKSVADDPALKAIAGTSLPAPWLLTFRHASLLKVALRLYEAETGKLAERLTDLVPKYLSSIPTDPYDGKPFRYRVSPDEFLENNSSSPALLGVRPRQGILWSVGEDGRDDGGLDRDKDQIFLVPRSTGRD